VSTLALSTVVALLSSSSTHAAAYYVGEATTRAMARGGANIVNPGDASALWLNPGALTQATGVQLQIDLSVVNMNAEFARDCGSSGLCGPSHVNRNYRGLDYRVDGDGRAPANDEEIFSAHTPNAGTLGQNQTPSRFDDGHVVRNQALPQPIPQIFASINLDSIGMRGLAIGGGVWAPNAGDYEFPADEVTRYTLIRRDLYEVYYGVSAAYAFGRWLSVGAGIQGVTEGLNQDVKLSADPYGNEDPESDILVNISTLQHFVPSANFGVWSNPFFGLELGASVQLGRTVKSSGPLTLKEFGPKVEELMAGDNPLVEIVEDNPTATVQITLPPIYRVGAKYDDTYMQGLFGFDIEAAFVYEQWSVFDHASVSTSGLSFAFSGGEPAPLAPIVQAKDYQDAWSLRLGGEVNLLEELVAVRGGVYYETSAIPLSTYTVELMNNEQIGFGLGASLQYWGVRLDLSWAHAQVFPITVGDESIVHVENTAPPTLSPGERRTRVAMGTYNTSYDIVSVSLNFKFDSMFGFGVVEKAPWNRPLIPGLESFADDAAKPQ
jgi:long-subunit fatty acid transport protein